MTKPIKYIVFDLGRVLIDFSFDELMNFFKANGIEKSLREFAQEVNFNAHEHGHLSREEFIQNCRRIVPEEIIKTEALLKLFVEIFSPADEMLNLLAQLRQSYPTYILSNTNELHWEYLVREYDLLNLADGTLTSFEVKAMKPDLKIYQAAVERFKLVPDQTVFIDDLEKNAEGARAAGWHAIHHRGYETTIAELKKLGVKV